MWNSTTRDPQLETIEIDPQYAQSLGFSEGETVDIGLLHDLPVASSVSTEPLSPDDWEILELHAEYVEHNLLSQVRVAAKDQEVDVWVLGRTRIRFRVVTCTPDVSAVVLSTDTEVVIAPKTRSSGVTPSPLPKPKPSNIPVAISTTPSKSTPLPGGNSTSGTATYRVLPSRLFKLPSKDFVQSRETTVWVSSTTFTTITQADLQANGPIPRCYVDVRRLEPPAVLSSGSSSSEGLTVAPKVLHAGTVHEQPTKNSSASSKLCRLSPSNAVPENHACITLGERGNIDGASDWDIISLTSISASRTHELDHEPETAAETLAPNLALESQHGLAGVDDVLTQGRQYILRAFATQDRSANTPAARSRMPALLVCGAAGSGRTSVAKEIARRLETDPTLYAYTVYLDMSKNNRAVGPEVEHADSTRAKQVAEVFVSIFSPSRAPTGVAIIATCQSQSTLHPLLSSSHIFSQRIALKAPGKDARRDILSRLMEDRITSSDISRDPQNPINFTSLATQTDGYSATDLRDLVGRAIHQAVRPILLMEDFSAAQVNFTPLSLRDVKLQKSEVQWSDIGGLHETRRVLRETLEWPTKYSAIFAKCPLRLRSGLLLYGFPGCGKTLLASAVAKECGLNFISVKGPELLNKYIGASEKSVRDLFERATAAKPCVLFFDEFDSIAPKRGHDSTGVTDRVVNQMLTQMDGAEGLDGVYVLAATSRPDLIDPALLRPGRLDKSLLCNMPDAGERFEILQALSRKIAISDTVDLRDLAQETEGYSGADLQAIIYNAHLEVVHEAVAADGHNEESTQANGVHSQIIDFTAFGGSSGGTIAARAERAAMERRLQVMLSSGSRKSKPTAFTAPKKRLVEDSHLHRSLSSTRPSVPPDERL
ncbi:Peroxisome biosynthesis protein pex1 [Tulasnella sp. 427]|nr:Peroxisome biosynthesis protein pex1 [Tulasnella sp. 427]